MCLTREVHLLPLLVHLCISRPNFVPYVVDIEVFEAVPPFSYLLGEEVYRDHFLYLVPLTGNTVTLL